MASLPKKVIDLSKALAKLPNLGPKSAARLAIYLVQEEGKAPASALLQALKNASEGLTICEQCQNVASSSPCEVCRDKSRDNSLLCVVENPLDLLAIERAGGYRGLYFVMGKMLFPLKGRGAQSLNIEKLIKRIKGSPVEEVILALNPSLEGEATMNYVSKVLAPLKIKVTRLARGLPTGADLEYVDEMTLKQAFLGRNKV